MIAILCAFFVGALFGALAAALCVAGRSDP